METMRYEGTTLYGIKELKEGSCEGCCLRFVDSDYYSCSCPDMDGIWVDVEPKKEDTEGEDISV